MTVFRTARVSASMWGRSPLAVPPLRKKFKKHTPPASYIGEDEPRPRSYWRGYERGITP
ncbi:MAG: hypothetical protein K2P94_17730 [Rhodospirillaceae bacterium]|nr:hypothetical protein [Rhodospirillaceae bacterium]